MMNACNQQTLSQVSCERIVFFRYDILLPKNVDAYLSRSSEGRSIALLAPVVDHDWHKTGQQGSLLTGLSIEKQERYAL
jgi:hypothetical protein